MVGQLRRPCSASADVALWVLFGISEAVPPLGVSASAGYAPCRSLTPRLSMVGQLRRPAPPLRVWLCVTLFGISEAVPLGGIRVRGLRSLSVAHAAVKHSWAAPPPCSASADVTLWVLFGISEAVPPLGVFASAGYAPCRSLTPRLSMVGQLRRPLCGNLSAVGVALPCPLIT